MSFQAVPNVALIRVEGVADNQLTINDLHFEISGTGITDVSLNALCTAIVPWVAVTLCPLLSNEWTATRVVGVDLTTVDGPEVTQNVSTAGGVSGEAVPNNVAACVSFRTAHRGRSFRGRNFVPGVPNSVVTQNTLSTPFITDLLAAYANLVGAGVFLPGWQFVVVSRRSGGIARPVGLAIPVTDVIMVGTSVRSMRSREIGHGA